MATNTINVSLPQDEMDKVSNWQIHNKWFISPRQKKVARIAADFDKAIQSMLDDNTLSKLSKETLGNDYSNKANYDKAHQK